jgi:hypothetical protein
MLKTSFYLLPGVLEVKNITAKLAKILQTRQEKLGSLAVKPLSDL